MKTSSEINTNHKKHKGFFGKLRSFWLFAADCKDWGIGKKIAYFIFNAVILLLALLALGTCSMLLAYGTAYPHAVFLGYIENVYILFLNLLVPVLLFLLLYGIIGRGWIAYLLDAVAVMVLSTANFYLLRFRDDPLMFSDILYLKEAAGISAAQDYDYSVTKRMLFCFAVCLFMTLILLLFNGYRPGIFSRIALFVLPVVVAIPLSNVYFDEHIYDIKTQNYDNINRWSQTQVYISKGFLYPFVHSIKDAFSVPPAGYDENEAKRVLSDYSDSDIPQEKKVNVIAIMLEAFCDLEKIGVTGINESVYADYRALRDKNLHGTLVTNIFAGGTIDSERAFLTGFSNLDNYRRNINSHVRYFNSQGYYTDGSHPSQDWFYNRKNVNNYLGFNDYRFSENYFLEKYGENMRLDSVVFPEFLKAFERAKIEGKTPYFGFHVTYQGHGPYSVNSREWGNGTFYYNPDISPESNYIIDNYLGSVKDTAGHLMWLVQSLEEKEEPVVLVVFGDHKPWLGDSNSVYNELGINIDVSTKEGFMNYYGTEYLIIANSAAKAALENDFTGEGETTSPCFLMNVLFSQLGWEGNAYSKYTDNVRSNLCALNSVGAIDNDGNFYTLGEMPPYLADVYNGFQRVAFYRSNENVK